MKKCPKCGKELPNEAGFCPYCMEKLTEEENYINSDNRRSKSKLVYKIICLILAVAFVSSGITFAVMNNNLKMGTNTEKPVTTWAMKLRPNGGFDSFTYCKEKNIIGFGWGIEGEPKTILEYKKLRQEQGLYPDDTLLNTTLDNFENALSTSYTHLVWTVDTEGNYYICEVVPGSYQYSNEEWTYTSGVHNFANCTFYKIGTADLVPQTIIDSLSGKGVINSVNDTDTVEVTTQLWKSAKAKLNVNE